MTPEQVLNKIWNYPTFRPSQKEIITSILEYNDTIALLPTGGGKSICYQIPGLLLDGICVVVSPLIALMQDQATSLLKKQISAVVLHSQLKPQEIDALLDNCIYGKVKFLFITPERITSKLFLTRLQKMKVNLFAIDEAHTAIQWGNDFRPAYLNIPILRNYCPSSPILALTATATHEVISAFEETLELRSPNIYSQSFQRPNIHFGVINTSDKLKQTVDLVKNTQCAIIYVRNRKLTEQIAQHLNNYNVPSTYYHGGLQHTIRAENQDLWMSGKARVIVATSAFGMGINKSNVRRVLHYTPPQSIEDYYQEAGRAGRDGKKSYAILLYNEIDNQKIIKQITDHFPSIQQIHHTLQKIFIFFQIAEGSGQQQSYKFDIQKFSARYNYSKPLLYRQIALLEKYQILSMVTYRNSTASIKITAPHSTILQSFRKHPVMQHLLRSHIGIFNNYVPINEFELAKHTKRSLSSIQQTLDYWQSLKIIIYNKRSSEPVITFHIPRPNPSSVLIDDQDYKTLEYSTKKKINAVIRYTENTTICRQKTLTTYFGETKNSNCNVCDICAKKKNSVNSIKKQRLAIEKTLKTQNLTLKEVFDKHQYIPKNKIIEHISWLIDNAYIKEIKNTYIWQ